MTAAGEAHGVFEAFRVAGSVHFLITVMSVVMQHKSPLLVQGKAHFVVTATGLPQYSCNVLLTIISG
jgi:hypothetical protein